MRVEKLFHLAWIDILAAANDHVPRSTSHSEISVGAHHCEIAGMKPAFRVDRFGGCLRLVVVTFHHQIAAGAELALLAQRNYFASGRRYDSHFRVRASAPHG